MALLRSRRCNVMAYLDDLPFGAKSAVESMRHGQMIVSTLRELGWIIQTAKCVGIETPRQHSTANHSRHSSRFTGSPLTATEEWKDEGRERTVVLSRPASFHSSVAVRGGPVKRDE